MEVVRQDDEYGDTTDTVELWHFSLHGRFERTITGDPKTEGYPWIAILHQTTGKTSAGETLPCAPDCRRFFT